MNLGISDSSETVIIHLRVLLALEIVILIIPVMIIIELIFETSFTHEFEFTERNMQGLGELIVLMSGYVKIGVSCNKNLKIPVHDCTNI